MKTRVGVEREGWSVMRVGGAELERVMGDGRRETWEMGDFGGRRETAGGRPGRGGLTWCASHGLEKSVRPTMLTHHAWPWVVQVS